MLYFSKKLDIGNLVVAKIKKKKPMISPSSAIMSAIFSVVKNSVIKKIFNEPNAPHPIAMVSKLKVGDRSSGVEFMYTIVLCKAE